MIDTSELLELLGPRLKARADIPSDFEPVTVRVWLRSEGLIIRSIFKSMSGGPDFYLTLEGRENGAVRFWKKRRPRAERGYSGSATTSVSNPP